MAYKTKEDLVLTFTNIDEEDFSGMKNGESFLVKAGETQILPTKLARHLAGQLTTKILMRNENANWTVENLRNPLIGRILGSIATPAEEPTPTPVISPETPKEEEFTETPKEEPTELKKRGRPKSK